MPSLLDMLRNPNGAPANPLMATMGIAPPAPPPNYTGVQAPVIPMGQAPSPLASAPPVMPQAAPTAPSAAPTAPSGPPPLTSSLTNPAGTDGGDQTVTGDPWKPAHHATFLGNVMDFLTGSTRHHDAAEHDNMVDAMKGFVHDPETAIRHVAMIDPKTAFNMYNVWQDNVRADGTSKAAEDTRRFANFDKTSGVISNIFQNANETNFPKLRQYALSVIKAHDGNPDDYNIPTTYDKETIEGMVNGSVPVVKQEAIDQRDRAQAQRWDQFTQTINENERHHLVREGQMGQQIQDLSDYRAQRIPQIQQSLTERNRHNLVTEHLNGHAGPQMIRTPAGPGEVSPDGNLLHVNVGGVDHFFKKRGIDSAGTHWEKVK